MMGQDLPDKIDADPGRDIGEPDQASVHPLLAKDQRAEVLVHRYEDPLICNGMPEDLQISGIVTPLA